MIKFKNLTPHTVGFQMPDGQILTFPSEGLARVDVLPGEAREIKLWNGQTMPVNPPVKYGAVVGLPEPDGETVFIVSLIVITQPSVAGRTDVIAPATGPKDGAIRDAGGQIAAVTRWVAA
ncbi:MAG: hypothetical protein UX06_C0042G0005 [Candidatus Giovannonibacteria bacterium GW2011_GWA2_45_21]|uniref:Uncharacterized protein n=1 Tax=Candidatus Giovannonibacteria bacterium GW2011_GWA2_45_21 TaxID=1618649 RepID=A0A0G1M536_9BACT|nr:MAG: hypothetical protein UX06_C0042G0005 [Candidatus Giovannonibacteria bacterium GW2011_GWA2_45_21]